MDAILAFLRAGVGGLFVVIGFAMIVGGAIGLLRFPDFYTRLQAARVADGLGAGLFLVGLSIASGDAAAALRLLLLAGLVVALAPVLSHLSANAAHTGGLAPLVGRYSAPRPGARRDPS